MPLSCKARRPLGASIMIVHFPVGMFSSTTSVRSLETFTTWLHWLEPTPASTENTIEVNFYTQESKIILIRIHCRAIQNTTRFKIKFCPYYFLREAVLQPAGFALLAVARATAVEPADLESRLPKAVQRIHCSGYLAVADRRPVPRGWADIGLGCWLARK